MSTEESGKKSAPADAKPIVIDRVQLNVRIEKRMAQVLKGTAEFCGVTLGELIEDIVLHSFAPTPGHEGQMAASAFSKQTLEAIDGLKKVYGMNYDRHASYDFRESESTT